MTIIYFILAALGLGVLVFIHELGHYIVAKKTGMIVEIFSIGFGKPLLKWRWHDVDWQLGSIPFGGYIKISGMEFGKKEKSIYSEPHEIPNGFFSKSPWKRIFVAFAGPFANFVLAFLIFTLLWVSGGREKPFNELTHIVGWIEPASELYALGLRPGDQLTSYNGKPYTNSKDLLYATMLSGKEVELSGFHIDYSTKTKKPFTYRIEAYQAPQSLEGILTTGISATARYLIYDRYPNGADNPLPEGSPMANSGIAYQDRLVWADGYPLFSMDQLSHLINEQKALLTIKRGEEIFLSRQPRVFARDLALPSYVKNEIIDWQYESGLKGRAQDLYMLPYVISSEGYVEAPLKFIDAKEQEESFPNLPNLSLLEQALEPGDRILAVDGTPVYKGYQLIQMLQSHRVQLVAERDQGIGKKVSWKLEDQDFEKEVHLKAIEHLTQHLGLNPSLREVENFVLLNPVEPKTVHQFFLSASTKEQMQEEVQRQRERIQEIRDPTKRNQAQKLLEQSQNKLLLGIYLQDRKVDYNPTSWVLFKSVFTETWYTLKALVTGYLNPKWMSGPVGIVQVLHQGWKIGVGEALFWLGAISVNLGFLNLLPIPVLDGGYICLSLWELITKRRLKAKTMERLIVPFVVLLIGLLIFLTFQDITRFFS